MQLGYSPSTISSLKLGLRQWYNEVAQEIDFGDPYTRDLCLAQIRELFESNILDQKVQLELNRLPSEARSFPLGRVLAIVSEKHYLGTIYALIGLIITGNRALIKARHTQRHLAQLLKIWNLNDKEFQIEDWNGQEDVLSQEDVSHFDGVLLAGGESLIQYFRKIAPPGIRLIEYGPKISIAVIGGTSLSEVSTGQLIYDTRLFSQDVCSSPQCILVEQVELAEQLKESLAGRINPLPSLSDEQRLQQFSKWNILNVMSHTQPELFQVPVLNSNGWGISLSKEIRPSLWFAKGFNLVVGSIRDHLIQLEKLFPHRLQTLGYAQWDDLDFAFSHGFSRVCPLGKMHQRSFLSPHDGAFELSQLVKWVSYDK